jgi:hypothetical protein
MQEFLPLFFSHCWCYHQQSFNAASLAQRNLWLILPASF